VELPTTELVEGFVVIVPASRHHLQRMSSGINGGWQFLSTLKSGVSLPYTL